MMSSTTNTYFIVHDVNNSLKFQDLRLGKIIQRDDEGSDEWTIKTIPSKPVIVPHARSEPDSIPQVWHPPYSRVWGFWGYSRSRAQKLLFQRSQSGLQDQRSQSQCRSAVSTFSLLVPGLLIFHVIHVIVIVVVISSLSVVKSLLYATLNPNDRLSECYKMGRRSIQDCLFYSTSNFQPCSMGPDDL